MKVTSTRLRRSGALIGLAGVAATVAFSSAGAYTGVTPGGDIPKTDAPDLVSAKIIRQSQNPSSGPTPQIQFCFDQTIATLGASGVTFFDGYDSAAFTNGTLANQAIDVNNQNCLVATYPQGQDIAEATVAGVGGDAVRDVGGRQNPFGTVPLQGGRRTAGTPGQTEGPQLKSVSVDSANNQATFTFDEWIATGGDETNFGFYTDSDDGAAGNTAARNGTAIVTQGPDFAVVQFPAGSLLSAKAFFVKGQQGPGPADGTPTDTAFDSGGTHPATVGLALVGTGLSAAPFVKSAAKDPNNPQLVNVTFDEAMTASGANAANIVAYRVDGTRITASSVGTLANNGFTVPVAFPVSAKDDANSVVSIGLAPGAVANAAGTGTNAYSFAAISTEPTKPGLTDAPDLVSTTIDDNNNRASFLFDEATQDGVTPNGANFLLLNQDGTTQPGNAAGATVSADQKTVTVQFPSAASSAVGTALNPGAVNDDATGDINASVSGNVSRTLINNQTGTQDATPTPTVTVAPTVTVTVAPTVTPNKIVTRKSTISIKRKSHGKKYTGKVGAKSPCKSGRTVRIYRGSKKLKTVKTKSSGSYSAKVKKQKKGKIKAKVAARTVKVGSTTYKCGAKTSKKV